MIRMTKDFNFCQKCDKRQLYYVQKKRGMGVTWLVNKHMMEMHIRAFVWNYKQKKIYIFTRDTFLKLQTVKWETDHTSSEINT